ncbi:hypothetical protein QTG54_010251 [Skeletonema marinoi]|uniref:FeS cluster biogenesis domain-containing protein n=1 Tax=Skeletonema marinoi TaxID=267567 RepID=A0AAD8Y5B9_9STRA|nr:hypothetical protein QTG54_010251 [Skeletonema marinoi]
MNNARSSMMMQSMIQRCILSASKTSKISSIVIRNTSSIAAAWADTNYNSKRVYYCHTPLNPLLTIATQRIQSSSFSSASGKATKNTKNKMIPRKAALQLTPKAREIFRKLIEATSSEGIKLKYEMSSQHALRMAFKFDLIKDVKKELSFEDEGVSLEVLDDGVTPKPPAESWNDNLPKLYIDSGAFMKVLGGKLDVKINPETGDIIPLLFDREGNEMDPNA